MHPVQHPGGLHNKQPIPAAKMQVQTAQHLTRTLRCHSVHQSNHVPGKWRMMAGSVPQQRHPQTAVVLTKGFTSTDDTGIRLSTCGSSSVCNMGRGQLIRSVPSCQVVCNGNQPSSLTVSILPPPKGHGIQL